MRCEEKSLKEQAIRDEARAKLVPHPRCGQAIGCHLHERAPPCDIAARRRKPAAGVLDERACHDVDHRDLRRLNGIDELSIAVVDKYNAVWIHCLDPCADRTDILDAERLTRTVAARALHQCNLRPRRHNAVDAIQIDVSIPHRQLVVAHAELLQRSDTLMRPANHGLHRIVRCARDGDELIAGTQDAEQHRCKRVRPRDELRPHERTLRTKDAGVELVQLLAPEITVRITRTHAEMRV